MNKRQVKKMRFSDNRRCSAADFTLVEFLVVAAILSILAALLLPALIRAKQTAVSVSCLSRLHQLYICNITYGDDYRNWLHPDYGHSGYNCPDTQWLTVVLYKYGYVKQTDIYLCPGWAPKHWSTSAAAWCYAIRYFNTVNLHGTADAVRMQHLAKRRGMFCDSINAAPSNEVNGKQSEGWYVHPRHPQKTANVCFNEGNAKSCQYPDAYAAMKDGGLNFAYFGH